ncbi:hypothetical protein PGT21_003817 [Puccinia graminis f. sp. tritici]|uniref:Uncharacterized protein n=1 Tax=Puccinia graminis f. sp. tritici TaxID=56615 RepID=A0A5B0Q5J0_PUCGR|nr:hypothetical protein PGT21_003817 [Puccinia graminis f. sp. tritici]KAA1136962.1 hypothetical protein PGTUg99_004401 [Puccinia graminis f. sp. tritici]
MASEELRPPLKALRQAKVQYMATTTTRTSPPTRVQRSKSRSLSIFYHQGQEVEGSGCTESGSEAPGRNPKINIEPETIKLAPISRMTQLEDLAYPGAHFKCSSQVLR